MNAPDAKPQLLEVTPQQAGKSTARDHATQPAPLPTIAGLQIEKWLADGGHGRVYLVRDEVGRRLVLKMLKPQAVSDPAVERFEREIAAMAKRTHANLAPIESFGEYQKLPYFTMPFYAHGTLRNHLKLYQADTHKSVRLIADVARGLAELHEVGIHRDIKPHNIFLDDDDIPKLGDFGLFKPFAQEADVTRSGIALGTPAYMSPEQARGARQIGIETDLWALGVVLYELVVGRLPFSGVDGEAVMQEVARGIVPAPRTWKPELDAHLERIILGCLQREPGGRYASAGALADDLDRWLRNEPPHGPRRKRRWRVRVAALSLIGVAALAAVAAYPSATPPVPPGAVPVADLPKKPKTRAEMMELGREQLALGKPLTFVDQFGRCDWPYEVVLGKTRAIVRNATEDGCFTLESMSGVALEWLDATGLDEFTYRAEVCERTAGADNIHGLYAGHAIIPTVDGPLNVLVRWTFDDAFRVKHAWHDEEVGRSEVWAMHVLARPFPGKRSFWQCAGLVGGIRPVNSPALRTPSGWHQMEWRVFRDKYEMRLDGKVNWTAQRRPTAPGWASNEHLPAAIVDGKPALPTYPNRGGVGLFVDAGSITVRNVQLLPWIDR